MKFIFGFGQSFFVLSLVFAGVSCICPAALYVPVTVPSTALESLFEFVDWWGRFQFQEGKTMGRHEKIVEIKKVLGLEGQ